MGNPPGEPEDWRVVEPEVVGRPKPPSLRKRLFARLAGAALLGLAGLSLCGFGAALILSLEGALLGILLLPAGLALLAGAVFLLIGGGTISIR